MKYFIDSAYESLLKKGEQLCGDKVEIIRNETEDIVVLADGLGSGVKANILATLTSKIIATMLFEGASLEECIQTIASTLPVCKVRGLSYCTFSILRISSKGIADLVQFDNPDSILVKNGKVLEFEKTYRNICDKDIFEASFEVEEGDFILLFSDGVIHAGVGNLLNLGWQRENVVKYVEQTYKKDLSSLGYCRQILAACDNLYGGEPGDDTTVAVINVRKPMPVYVMAGPPVNKEDDEKVVNELLSCTGKKIVCGGTTSKIVSKIMGKEVRVDLRYVNPSIPPIATIKGIDLVTEGVITLGKTLDIINKFCSVATICSSLKLDKKDGASMLAHILLEESTEVKFLIGRSMNPAHQNPNLPLSLGLKLRLVEEIANTLRKFGKQVVIEYY